MSHMSFFLQAMMMMPPEQDPMADGSAGEKLFWPKHFLFTPNYTRTCVFALFISNPVHVLHVS